MTLLTPQQTADRLGVAVGTLARWRCKSGQPDLAWVELSPRCVRYESAVVERFIEKRTRGGVQ